MKTIQGAWSTIATIVGRVLDIDPFWTVWLTAVVGVIAGMRVLGGPWATELGTAATPFYLAGIGAVSIVYALLLEAVPRRGAGVPPTIDCAPANPSVRPRGESMIPGATGLALVVFSIFLYLAISRRELTILVVGLPLVVIVAPMFVLFSFGYTRGEPTIGAFGYRVMPWGFAAFLVLAGAVLVERRFRILGSGNGLAVPLLIVVVAGLVCATSLYRAWRATQDAEGPKPPG